jgi:cytochrome c peroxidase
MDLGRFADIPPLLASPFNSAGAFSDDPGAGRLAGLTATVPDSAKGQFRTPSLRNVAVTAPYMHAGQLQTLEQVVDYYDGGGQLPTAGSKDPLMKPLGLSPQEKAALVSFLKTLTGAPIAAALLQDTSAP